VVCESRKITWYSSKPSDKSGYHQLDIKDIKTSSCCSPLGRRLFPGSKTLILTFQLAWLIAGISLWLARHYIFLSSRCTSFIVERLITCFMIPAWQQYICLHHLQTIHTQGGAELVEFSSLTSPPFPGPSTCSPTV
jgi:hypothetical protein